MKHPFQSGRISAADVFVPSRRILVLASVIASLHGTAFGWVYPEHREITLRAIQQLDPHRKAMLDTLWAEARKGYESRLSVTPADLSAELNPKTIDYASWPAIAGDHSTSAAEMIRNIAQTDWILQVAGVASRLNAAFSAAGLERHAITNAVRDADLRLLRVDPDYATRAGANNVHFLLARPNAETDAETYIQVCMENGCELNALGTYAWYHVSALRKAALLSRAVLPDPARNQLALAALADEAFAIHFLQDVFAAGHVAGTRGDASSRKGTHDYYNEHGLEVRTWDGTSMVLKGDAWMRSEDAERSARAVLASLGQLVDASEGRIPFPAPGGPGMQLDSPDTLNVSTHEVMPAGQFSPAVRTLLTQIIRTTPVPGLAEGEGELPRFRAELGPFIGVVPAVRGAALFGGFGQNQTAVGAIGGLEIAVRLGLGLDGVMNESGDGLVFLDLGFRLDAASSIPILESEGIREFGSIFAAVPSRGAFSTRLRVPFWLLPFDLLIAAPFLAPTSPETFTQMAAVAGNGGLIPWQAGIATSVGRFQMILGREVGVSLYGFVSSARLLLPYGDPDPAKSDAVLANLRSVQLEFPVVEYMPFRSFSSDQSSSLVIQLYGSVDIPTGVSNIFPESDPALNLRSVWQIGLRAAFRWRHYW